MIKNSDRRANVLTGLFDKQNPGCVVNLSYDSKDARKTPEGVSRGEEAVKKLQCEL
jgi:hypothetical protein